MWTENLSEREDYRTFRLLRPRVDRPLHGQILSDTLLSHRIHWFEGRTRPCRSPGLCIPCESGCDGRLEGYFYLRLLDGAIQIVALPYYPALELAKLQQRRKTLRGLTIMAERTGKTDRSRVKILVRDTGVDGDAWPNLPDLRHLIERIWGAD